MTRSTFCSTFEIPSLAPSTEMAVDFVRSVKSKVRLNWASDVSLLGQRLG